MTKVLVVDDDRILTRALALALRSYGFEVLTANTADSAAQWALRECPDVILLDIEMPGYTGLEFHECLQFSERGRRIPVVYLTGSTNPMYRQIAQKLGARRMLHKPCDTESLVHAIQAELGRKP